MRKTSSWSLFVVLAVTSLARGCLEIEVSSDALGTVFFKQVSQVPKSKNESEAQYQSTGRAVYKATRDESEPTSPDIYLYHTISDEMSGVGRWVINEDFGSADAAMAYIDSWSVTPVLTDESADSDDARSWMIPTSNQVDAESGESAWVFDRSLELFCVDEDDTVYFESSATLQPSLAGFYVQTLQTPPANRYAGPLYSQIKISPLDRQVYMFKLSTGVWMIGEEPGVDAGLAYTEDAAVNATSIRGHDWKFISGATTTGGEPEWIVDESAYMIGPTVEYPADDASSTEATTEENGGLKQQTFANIYESLRFMRSLKYVPLGQQYYTLRNSMPMPQLGLGTGGLALEETKNVVKLAMKVGYRSLDLAREYKNEHLVGELIAEALEDESMPLRGEMFLETKVWPTELGFFPTSDAILTSLEELKTNYVDLYLIHWPECNKDIDWMHCDDTKDKDAIWNESWRALEKAYAEGRLMSIGVSNFNETLLNEVTAFASIRPHVVQNWAEIGRVDEEVRTWCFRNDAVYQPYASLRNLNDISPEMQGKLAGIAAAKGVSTHAAALRFFLQTGAAGIPRSAREEHLRDNLNVFNFELAPEEMKDLGWHLDPIEAGAEDEEEEEGEEEGEEL